MTSCLQGLAEEPTWTSSTTGLGSHSRGLVSEYQADVAGRTSIYASPRSQKNPAGFKSSASSSSAAAGDGPSASAASVASVAACASAADSFDVGLMCFTCANRGRAGRLFVTATHVAFLPLWGGRRISIHLDRIQCVVKCKAWRLLWGEGRTLRVVLQPALPASVPFGDESLAPVKPHSESFHGFFSREQALAAVVTAARARGHAFSVYSQTLHAGPISTKRLDRKRSLTVGGGIAPGGDKPGSYLGGLTRKRSVTEPPPTTTSGTRA